MSTLLMVLWGSTAQAADAAAGELVFSSNCAACHGAAADGKGPAAVALQPSPTDFTAAAFWEDRSDDDLKASIRSGRPGTSMMAFDSLSEDDLDNILAFLKTKRP